MKPERYSSQEHSLVRLFITVSSSNRDIIRAQWQWSLCQSPPPEAASGFQWRTMELLRVYLVHPRNTNDNKIGLLVHLARASSGLVNTTCALISHTARW